MLSKVGDNVNIKKKHQIECAKEKEDE